MSKSVAENKNDKLLIIIAFLCVYFIWGSTYFAIRYAVLSIPPMLMAATRFIAASLIMFFLSSLRKESPLSRNEKSYGFKTGAFLMTANAIICYVEKWIPSGVVAVVVGAMPIWIMLLGYFVFKREKLSKIKYLGACVGLLGVGIIAYNSQPAQSEGAAKYIIFILIFSSWMWAFGSQLQRNMGHSVSPLRYAGFQMISGGILVFILSLILEKPFQLDWSKISFVSSSSWLYLVIFGSVVGFTAYSYLSQKVEPHVLSSYALINPVIAVLLGSMLGHEALSKVFSMATAIVLLGLVFLIFERKNTLKIPNGLDLKK